jgi:Mg2+ and Co2+ transporter CorA
MSAMSSDPFYALTELFAFVSASEIEFLNIIALKLDESMTGTPDLGPDTAIHVQASLVHYQRVLEDHAHRICETLTFVKNRTSLKWARSQASKAITAAARLEHDFEYILDRTRQLQQRCQRELTIMMNNANIGEARRGIEQGKRVFKFTLLAFTYVPLSFSCSIFGMNFVQFSERGRGYLIWALVSLPIFLVSILIILWDGPKLRKWTKRIFGSF